MIAEHDILSKRVSIYNCGDGTESTQHTTNVKKVTTGKYSGGGELGISRIC